MEGVACFLTSDDWYTGHDVMTLTYRQNRTWLSPRFLRVHNWNHGYLQTQKSILWMKSDSRPNQLVLTSPSSRTTPDVAQSTITSEAVKLRWWVNCWSGLLLIQKVACIKARTCSDGTIPRDLSIIVVLVRHYWQIPEPRRLISVSTNLVIYFINNSISLVNSTSVLDTILRTKRTALGTKKFDGLSDKLKRWMPPS
jgi:hypothetical protein